ncbi:helix-turn-helix domain-containing protein, partial [Rhodococcus sp. NPDC058514]
MIETRRLPESIRLARVTAGLTLRELARRLTISPATLSAIENGKTGVSVERLHALAAALGTTAAHLMGEDGNPPPPAGRRVRTSRSESPGTATTGAH